MIVQVVGALLTGSLALLADAAHMFTDASALVIALIAATVAARPADDRRTFGYQRAEVFGALINAVILIALATVVAVQGVQRLLNPSEVEVAGGLMLVVAVVGLVANAVSMWLLSRAQRTNLNVRGAYLEVMGDLLGSLMVIIAAGVILVTGWMPADALASLFIAAMIIPGHSSCSRRCSPSSPSRRRRAWPSGRSAPTCSATTASSESMTCTCGSSPAEPRLHRARQRAPGPAGGRPLGGAAVGDAGMPRGSLRRGALHVPDRTGRAERLRTAPRLREPLTPRR